MYKYPFERRRAQQRLETSFRKFRGAAAITPQGEIFVSADHFCDGYAGAGMPGIMTTVNYSRIGSKSYWEGK
jgi:hypothetical protein